MQKRVYLSMAGCAACAVVIIIVSLLAVGCGSKDEKGQEGSDAALDGSSSNNNHEVTVIQVTDTVLTAGAQRFGINLGDDNFWDSVLNKNRIKNGGFEGIIYRHIARGPGGDEQSFYDWNDYTFTHSSDDDELSSRTWLDIAEGASAWVLAGDRRWQQDLITSVEHAVFPGREDEGERLRFIFADTGPAVGVLGTEQLDEVGMLIEKVENTGFLGQHGGPLWTFASGGARITTEQTDLPPGTTGSSVAVIEAPGDESAKLMYPFYQVQAADPDGTWLVSFWAKGDGDLTIGYGPWGDPINPQPVSLTDEWQYFDEIAMNVQGFSGDTLALHLSVTGGTVKLDDIEAYKDGETNPTTFRDEIVEVLKTLRPGSLRHLFMGGSSVDNSLRRDHERMAFSYRRDVPPDPSIPWPAHPNTNGGADTHPFGIHEFLELCEEIDAQPWICVSGTIFPDEMENLMEYLAGPVTSPYGALREERGHAQPWTEVFDAIHIEMGNEAWNWSYAYAYGGWNGPDYWTTLFERARATLDLHAGASERVRFHIGAQNYNTWLGQGLVEYHGQAADGYAIAPYIIHEMNETQGAMNDEQLFSWAFAWVWYLNTGGPMQTNADMIASSESPHLEISVYEVNHHITGGEAPIEPRNKVVASIGGALNVINHMLLMLKHYGVRVQNFFSFFQESYNDIKLWGSVLSAREGQQRFRPTFLALMLANRVLAGDVVETPMSGENPTWHETVVYDETPAEVDVPYIHAYATRNGQERGLILINLHRTDTLPVRVDLPAPAQGGAATMWAMTGDSITSDNELDHEPQVTVSETPIADFTDGGYELPLPPHSMTVISWTE